VCSGIYRQLGIEATRMTQSTPYTEQRSNHAAVWLSAAVLLCALAWLGHRLVFAQFQEYDDEGYLLVTVQQFLKGLPIYDQVYTQYGPAYYLWQQVLHTVFGIPVTHDATRLVTIAVWLTCAVLVGSIVWFLTKRQVLTVIGTVAAFLHLVQLAFEPGHPQELCTLGVLGALALTTWRLAERKHIGPAASMCVWGLVAVTAFSKINVGAFRRIADVGSGDEPESFPGADGRRASPRGNRAGRGAAADARRPASQ
jgi:hypothetical protein